MGRELARKKAERSAEGALRDELDVWSGEWNTTTMDRLRRAEKLEGRRQTQPEIQELVEYTMEEFSIPRDYVPYNDKSK